MKMEYEIVLKELKLTLESDIIDPAFLNKVNEFQAKLKNNELTEAEIKEWDDDLVKMFYELHPVTEVENEELTAANRKLAISAAKNEIADAETIEALTALQTKLAHLTELAPFIEKRIEKLQKAVTDEAQAKFLSDATQEIKAAAYDDLQTLFEKYKDHLPLIEIINARIEKEKPVPVPETLRDKLSKAKKREWSYADLKAIGITPTEQDMEIEGVYLERQYMFRIYKITAVDGKKI